MSDRKTAEQIRQIVERNQARGNVKGTLFGFGGRECAEGSAMRLGINTRNVAKACIKYGRKSVLGGGLSPDTPCDHIGINDVHGGRKGRDGHRILLGVADKLDGGRGRRRAKAPGTKGVRPQQQAKEKRDAEREAKREADKEARRARQQPGRAGCIRTAPAPSAAPGKGSSKGEPIDWHLGSVAIAVGLLVLAVIVVKAVGAAVGALLAVLAMVGTVVGWVAVAALVLMALRLAWLTLGQVNYVHVQQWWGRNRARATARGELAERRAQMLAEVHAPIALGPGTAVPSAAEQVAAWREDADVRQAEEVRVR